MIGSDSAPAALESRTKQQPGSINVQCTKCGHVQELDPEYKICLNCGGPVDENDYLILDNPRKGRGMQGLAILSFILFVFVFFFWSKYIGRHGMAISALFYIWGFYKNYLYKREATEQFNPPPGGVGENGDFRES
jgi:hypothetical protein